VPTEALLRAEAVTPKSYHTCDRFPHGEDRGIFNEHLAIDVGAIQPGTLAGGVKQKRRLYFWSRRL
jgi:hypothetical protein